MKRRVARVGTPASETRMQFDVCQNLWLWRRWKMPPVSMASTNFASNGSDGELEQIGSRATMQSPFGLCESVGYVWEWTSTLGGDEEAVHIAKGGCYNDPAMLIRTHVRLEAAPKDKFETIGFRCVKSA